MTSQVPEKNTITETGYDLTGTTKGHDSRDLI